MKLPKYLPKESNELREPFLKFIESELDSGFVLIACGLPGTWKTETTEEISRITGYPLLRTDLIRLEVLKDEDVFDEKVATNMGKRTRVYEEMFKRADTNLPGNGGVILDATFVNQSLRVQAAAVAAKHNLKFVILETNCPQEVSIRRILERTKEDYVSNALTEQAYLNNKKKFEVVNLEAITNLHPNLKITHLTVDTTLDPPDDWYIIDRESK
ncbi:AAA family ATPase [Chloroflexota bacterium]